MHRLIYLSIYLSVSVYLSRSNSAYLIALNNDSGKRMSFKGNMQMLMFLLILPIASVVNLCCTQYCWVQTECIQFVSYGNSIEISMNRTGICGRLVFQWMSANSDKSDNWQGRLLNSDNNCVRQYQLTAKRLIVLKRMELEHPFNSLK